MFSSCVKKFPISNALTKISKEVQSEKVQVQSKVIEKSITTTSIAQVKDQLKQIFVAKTNKIFEPIFLLNLRLISIKLQRQIKIIYKTSLIYFSQRSMDQTMSFLMSKTKPVQSQIQANPWDLIPIKNSKQAKNTTQIHLGNRQATILTNFQHFPNLQIVWLNKNNLASLNGLQNSFRVKHLFLQNNKIKKLQNTFYSLKYIQTLVLYDNQLRDLQKVLQSLKPLSNLKHLDLYDNPVSQEPNYKLRVLYAIPSLQILDRHKVSAEQREEAVRFMAGSKGKNKSTKKPFSW